MATGNASAAGTVVTTARTNASANRAVERSEPVTSCFTVILGPLIAPGSGSRRSAEAFCTLLRSVANSSQVHRHGLPPEVDTLRRRVTPGRFDREHARAARPRLHARVRLDRQPPGPVVPAEAQPDGL